MVNKANADGSAESKKELLEEVKTSVENLKDKKTYDEIKKEIEDFAGSRGEIVKSFNITENNLVNAIFVNKEGREVRHYSRPLDTED